MSENQDSTLPPESEKSRPKTAKPADTPTVPEQSLKDRLTARAGDGFVLLRIDTDQGFGVFVPGTGAYKIGYDGFIASVAKGYPVHDVTDAEYEAL